MAFDSSNIETVELEGDTQSKTTVVQFVIDPNILAQIIVDCKQYRIKTLLTLGNML